MSSEKQKKIRLTYKNIKHALLASLTPSWVVLRDSLDKDHFDEALEAFADLLIASSTWLKVAEQHTVANGSVIDPDTVNKIIKHPVSIDLQSIVERKEERKKDLKNVTTGGY